MRCLICKTGDVEFVQHEVLVIGSDKNGFRDDKKEDIAESIVEKAECSYCGSIYTISWEAGIPQATYPIYYHEEGFQVTVFGQASIVAETGNKKIELTNIGEGRCGDYDPEDPDDVPLIRFYFIEQRDGAWEDVDGGSECTCLSVKAPISVQVEAAIAMLSKAVKEWDSIKTVSEELSWISEEKIPIKTS